MEIDVNNQITKNTTPGKKSLGTMLLVAGALMAPAFELSAAVGAHGKFDAANYEGSAANGMAF